MNHQPLLAQRFAWYGRLSTKDKQDPTISFPSQREACAKKAAELGGQIVCDFTDQEAGRRDDREGWIEAQIPHEPLISDEWFERVQAEMHRREVRQVSPRRRAPSNAYLLSGYVHCCTGHNPLRMQGKTRKDNIYYACGYRISYGDRAAGALGHGKWQYIREDVFTERLDRFFAYYVFGPNRLTHFKAQQAELKAQMRDPDHGKRKRLTEQLSDVDRRLERQVAAIEAGVEPALVSQRIQTLQAERHEIEMGLAALTAAERHQGIVDIDRACAIIDALPDLSGAIKRADTELRRRVYDAFRLSLNVDRNSNVIKLKALISSAFSEANDLDDLLVAHKGIAGNRYSHISDLWIPVEAAFPWRLSDLAPRE